MARQPIAAIRATASSGNRLSPSGWPKETMPTALPRLASKVRKVPVIAVCDINP